MSTSRPAQLAAHFIETPEARVADLHFLRPSGHFSVPNPIAINHLLLYSKKVENSGLLRPSYDADPLFLRHFLSILTNKPLTISSLPLCALAELPSVIAPHAFPTTYN